MILVALIAIASLVILGSTRVFENMARQTQLRVDYAKAHYLAQAGIMRAIYDWRISTATEANRVYAESTTTIAGTNNLYKVALHTDGTYIQSNFAYYNQGSAAWATVGAGVNARRRLRAWSIANIHTNVATDNFTITKCRVSWTPDNGAKLRDIQLSGTTFAGAGSYTNGQEITATSSFSRNSGQNYSGNTTYFEWRNTLADAEATGPPDPIAVTVRWTFTDDSSTQESKSHEVLCWGSVASGIVSTVAQAGAAPTWHTFLINSTGEVNQTMAGYFKVLKTVKAVVSGTPATAEIIDWEEGDTNAA